MPKTKKKSSINKEIPKKRIRADKIKTVLEKTDGNGCTCSKLESIVEKLQTLSEKIAAESLYDSYDQFSKYISSLLRGLPKKSALSLKRKLVNDILEVVNAQGDPSTSNKGQTYNADTDRQESTIPDPSIASPCGTLKHTSRESSGTLRTSRTTRSSVPRTRAQKRKQSFNESNSKRAATEVQDPVDEPVAEEGPVVENVAEEENEAISSCNSLPNQDENATLIEFEDGRELYDMKFDQEIVKDVTFELMKQEAPDPLGETIDGAEDIAQLFLCDVCLTQCPNREVLSLHFQQQHPGSTEMAKDLNIVATKNKEVQKWVDDSFEVNEMCNEPDEGIVFAGSSRIEAIKEGDFNIDTNNGGTNDSTDQSPLKILGIQELEDTCREEEAVDNSSFHLELNESNDGVSNDGVVDSGMAVEDNLTSGEINQSDLTSGNNKGDNNKTTDGSHTNMNLPGMSDHVVVDSTAAANSVINQNDVTKTNDKGDANKSNNGSQIKILGIQELGESSLSIGNTEAGPSQVKKICSKKRRNCCLFCKKINTNMERHIVVKHKIEKDVIQYMSTHNKNIRKKLMAVILNKGNYRYNLEMVEKGQRNLFIANKRRNNNLGIESYVACKNCFGTFVKNHVYRHFKQCYASNVSSKLSEQTLTNKTCLKDKVLFYIQSEASKPLLQDVQDVISCMKQDHFSDVIRHEPLILSFGSKAYNGSKEKIHIKKVSWKMRQLSKVLILMKERNKNIKTLEECLSEHCVNDIIDVIKEMVIFDDNDFCTIYVPMRSIGISLKECVNILRKKISKNKSYQPEKQKTELEILNKFVASLKKRWISEFGFNLYGDSKTPHQANYGSSSDDVILAFKRITELCGPLIKTLKDNPSPDNYKMLAKKCVVQLVIFNRSSLDQISHALLEHYNEKRPASQIDLPECGLEEFSVSGGSCKNDFCLLTKPMIQAIDALIASRDQLKITSRYLFHQTNIDDSESDHILYKEAINEVGLDITTMMKKPDHGVSQKILLDTIADTIAPQTHSDDVTMAFKFISKSYEKLIKELEVHPTPARYCVLAMRCIAHLIILNRCKETKVTEALLEEYKQLIKEVKAQPYKTHRTIDKFVPVYKFNALDNTTIVLNNQMKMAIGTLLASREPLQITGKHLFSQPKNNKEKLFNGEEIISELREIIMFNLKVPDNFTAFGLRYHKVMKETLMRFIVPCSEDITTLFKEVNNAYEVLKKVLYKNPSSMKYSNLSMKCIAQLIIFNKCEETEVTHALLENYEQIRNVSSNDVEVFEFVGSENDSPPLLVNKQTKEAIDALIASRNQLGIISKYLFALPNDDAGKKVFSGEQAANSLKHVCTFELKQPFSFTVDALRNHNVNQDILLSTSPNVGNETELSNPLPKHVNKSSSKGNSVKQGNSTVHSIERSEITEVPGKNVDRVEKNISLENTVNNAGKGGKQGLEDSQRSTFASTFAKFCLPVLNSDSDSEDTCKTPIVRKRWSDEEKDVVYKYFGRHLLNLQNPGRQEIGKMLQKEPVLKNRSLDQVNVYVNNIVTEKVKLTPAVVKRIKKLCS